MLSRKGSRAGAMSAANAATAAAGVDRGRVGERLQAALAGLQELRLLRDRQGDMVSWALRAHREEPLASVRAGRTDGAGRMGAEEQRLEATLTALKQQLSRLRKQDVGLRTHLQQLDEQISELKLDVSKASTDQLESDSRPSSGFYELSDGGSCSLSNSCTSVYSECLSSSQTSLLLLPHASPANPRVSPPPPRADACRRRSADESAAQPAPPRATGLHLGSSRIRAGAPGAEQARPRPVSTGDLDKMLAQGLSYCKSADARKPAMCADVKASAVDPKFQSNLVSRSGTEVYHYPSPLHAVALQSPIFSHGGDPASSSDARRRARTGHETVTQSYIGKVILRNLSKVQCDAGAETVPTHTDYHCKPTQPEVVLPEGSQKEVAVLQPLPAQTPNVVSPDTDQKRHRMAFSSQHQAANTNHTQTARAPEVSYRYSYPVATRECNPDEVAASSLKRTEKSQGECASMARSNPDSGCGDNPESRPQERNDQRQRSVTCQSSGTEESRGFEVSAAHPEFVHARFVPGGSQRVKVRQADRKTRAVKLRRKSSEKPRAPRQPRGCSPGERTRETGGGAKGEQRRPGGGKATQRCADGPAEEEEERRRGSGSDSSRSSPGLAQPHKGHPKPHPVPAVARSGRSRRLPAAEWEQAAEPRKGRPSPAKRTADVEMQRDACAQRQRSNNANAVQAPASVHMLRGASVRSGQWIGAPRSFQSPVSSSSFLRNLNARYPPAPFHASGHHPSRCESEYSAECASLFHSTIAESSEGETSDHTANRFGDSESSRSARSASDSDGSLSPDDEERADGREGEGRGLVWAEAALGPTAAGLALRRLPRPEPPACRIKASRALKKKIRRFQPASLKVMTLV